MPEQRKRNNSSWVCDRLEELIAKYEKEAQEDCISECGMCMGATFDNIIDELKAILYRE